MVVLDSPLDLVISCVRETSTRNTLWPVFCLVFRWLHFWYNWFALWAYIFYFTPKAFWGGLPQPAEGGTAQQCLGAPAKGSHPLMRLLIVEAAARPRVSNSSELYWCVLVWRRERLKLKSYRGPGEHDSGGLQSRDKAIKERNMT